MADLIIHDEDVAFRLLEIARREERPVEAVLKSMLANYTQPESDEDEPKPGTFAALAASARRAGLASENPVDTSERTREIMKTEFADHISRHTNEQTDAD